MNVSRGNGRKLLGLVLIWANLIVGLALIIGGTDELRLADAWKPESNQVPLPRSEGGGTSIPVWMLCAVGMAIGLALWIAPTPQPPAPKGRRRRR